MAHPMHDPIKYLLWAGGACLLIAVACGIYIVWINAGSRNLALGLGALIGACVIFAIQVLFELQGKKDTTDFPVEFVIDYQLKAVRSNRAYHPQGSLDFRNVMIETWASEGIAAATPKIARDLTLLSIVSYLLDEQFDWQLEAIVYKTGSETMTTSMPLSRPADCTYVKAVDLQRQLRAAGNMFANLPRFSMRDSLCLPPHSQLEITSNSVTLRTLVCTIELRVREPFAAMHSIDPHSFAKGSEVVIADVPTLPNGDPRYLTITLGNRATIHYSPFRAQDRNLSKYQSWASRLIAGLRSRLEPRPAAPLQ
jgi:hypothetical protein